MSDRVTETVKSSSTIPIRLPDFVEPMKAKLVDSVPSGDWIYEIKFDGYRGLPCASATQVLTTIADAWWPQ
jgi:bifunctional non-homologous end joining protein LigD